MARAIEVVPYCIFSFVFYRALVLTKSFLQLPLCVANIYLPAVALVALQAINYIGAIAVNRAIYLDFYIIKWAPELFCLGHKRTGLTVGFMAGFHTWEASLSPFIWDWGILALISLSLRFAGLLKATIGGSGNTFFK